MVNRDGVLLTVNKNWGIVDGQLELRYGWWIKKMTYYWWLSRTDVLKTVNGDDALLMVNQNCDIDDS